MVLAITTGKSTLLRALAVGVYNKIPGDGRELAVTDPGAVTIRAEDGRPVSGVDISPFISSLPSSSATVVTATATDAAETEAAGTDLGRGAEAAGGRTDGSSGVIDKKSNGGEGVTTKRFSTGGASGSTSQAANVVEALEAGATALLLDEDTCAGNVRGARMGGWGVTRIKPRGIWGRLSNVQLCAEEMECIVQRNARRRLLYIEDNGVKNMSYFFRFAHAVADWSTAFYPDDFRLCSMCPFLVTASRLTVYDQGQPDEGYGQPRTYHPGE